jgi:tetratricopeptide (TPR) repeat protein
MRRLLPLATNVAMLLLVVPAKGDDRQECAEQEDHDRRIAACSNIIDKASLDAAAYHNRGEARSHKGDLDGAIADYSKAIEIDPSLVRAYDGRARAYVSKGDYVRAVGDATRARELEAMHRSSPTRQQARAELRPRARPKASPAVDWRMLCEIVRRFDRIARRF